MKLPASPGFIKFFETVSKEEQNLFLAKMYTFFSNIEGRTSPIEAWPDGERTHPSLNTIKYHCFPFERHKRREYWYVSFYDTAIPHARIEMWNCYPPLKKDYSLMLDYTQLLIKNSLADIAEGFDDAPKPFFQNILNFLPENWFATVGVTTWVYLILKMRAIPKLYKQFSVELEPKLPFLDFGNYLSTKTELELQIIVRISMNKNSVKLFLQQNDALILNILGREEITDWLNYLNIEFDVWFSGIALPLTYL